MARDFKESDVIYRSGQDGFTHWWLSYADPDLPKGTQFLGVLIIEATEFVFACFEASVQGLNPGGEVQGTPFSLETSAKLLPSDIGVLLDKAAAAALDERLAE